MRLLVQVLQFIVSDFFWNLPAGFSFFFITQLPSNAVLQAGLFYSKKKQKKKQQQQQKKPIPIPSFIFLF